MSEKTKSKIAPSVEFKAVREECYEREKGFTARNSDFSGYEEMYFMDDASGMNKSNRDASTIKETLSPSANNEVKGMHRLLKTSVPRFTMKGKGTNNDLIEKGLSEVVAVSAETKQARIEHDVGLSSILYGMATLSITFIDDLLDTELNDVDRTRLEELRLKTPALLECIPAPESFPKWGKWGLREHLRVYSTTVEEVQERWGEDVLPKLKRDEVVIEYDNYGPEFRTVWIKSDDKEPIFHEAHGLKRLPISVKMAGGSSLFRKPERQLQPFLYGKHKGELLKRENLLLTTLFTSIFERGTGPLIQIDPDDLDKSGQIQVKYAGALRYIVSKGAKLLNDKAFDSDLLQAKAVLDSLSAEATLYKQTLGQNLPGESTFSALSQLSQSGQLPTVDPKECASAVFRDAGLAILQRIKDDGMHNEQIPPSTIPDVVDLECAYEIKLPQDTLRNANVAAKLGDKVSSKWLHENLLQIDDSNAMQMEIWSEQYAALLFQDKANDLMEFMKAKAQQMQQAKMAAVQNNQAPTDQDPIEEGMGAGGGEGMPRTDPVQRQDPAAADEKAGV